MYTSWVNIYGKQYTMNTLHKHAHAHTRSGCMCHLDCSYIIKIVSAYVCNCIATVNSIIGSNYIIINCDAWSIMHKIMQSKQSLTTV